MSLRCEVSLKRTLPENRTAQVQCGTCRRSTSHKVLTAALEQHDYPGQSVATWWTEYMAIQCEGCKSVSLLAETWSDEDYDEHGEWVKTQAVYPPRWAESAPIEDLRPLPGVVRRVYQEAYSAAAAGLRVLCGMGIRATVEAVCNDRNVKMGPPGGRSPSLESRIKAMAEGGMITAAQESVLLQVKSVGDSSAHRTRAHEERQLAAALDVVNHLLLQVYFIPRRARDLP